MVSGARAKTLRDDGLHPCVNCGALKAIEEFRPCVGGRGSIILRSNRCRACRAARSLAYHHLHRDEIVKRKRETYDPEMGKRRTLRYMFGMELEEYKRLIVKQGGACAICGQPETARHNDGRTRSLAVDHDHASGAIRGLLCANCNNGIGRFSDDPNLLEAAASYLKGAVAFAENRRRNADLADQQADDEDAQDAVAW